MGAYLHDYKVMRRRNYSIRIRLLLCPDLSLRSFRIKRYYIRISMSLNSDVRVRRSLVLLEMI